MTLQLRSTQSSLDNSTLKALFILDYTNPAYDNGRAAFRNQPRGIRAVGPSAAKNFGSAGSSGKVYEPKHPPVWPPRTTVKDYTALALAVAREVRAGAPSEK